MDRTNWQFGKRDINFLAITIIVGKVSIPIVLEVLPAKTKRGNSTTTQRIGLTRKLLGIVTITFLICFAWGCHLRVTGQKTSAATKRKSLFRLGFGLEDVKRLFEASHNNSLFIKEQRAFLQWLQTAKCDSIFLV